MKKRVTSGIIEGTAGNVLICKWENVLMKRTVKVGVSVGNILYNDEEMLTGRNE